MRDLGEAMPLPPNPIDGLATPAEPAGKVNVRLSGHFFKRYVQIVLDKLDEDANGPAETPQLGILASPHLMNRGPATCSSVFGRTSRPAGGGV